MSKISPEAELNIIIGRAMGQTYDRLIETTGHGNSTISRVLKPDNLCKHVVTLYAMVHETQSDAIFYKKWLHIALFVWAMVTAIQLGLYFIF